MAPGFGWCRRYGENPPARSAASLMDRLSTTWYLDPQRQAVEKVPNVATPAMHVGPDGIGGRRLEIAARAPGFIHGPRGAGVAERHGAIDVVRPQSAWRVQPAAPQDCPT
jgi:hypothetical protein